MVDQARVPMTSTNPSNTMGQNEYQLIGLGFGPANLAVAAAYHSKVGADAELMFFESRADNSWHPGMLLPGSEMQTPFLLDLATPYDPTSEFTFLNYLRNLGLFDEFVALETFFPSRHQFCAYLRWVGQRLTQYVTYNSTALNLSLDERGFSIRILHSDGMEKTYRSRDCIVGIGARPRIPKPLDSGCSRVVHSENLIPTLQEISFDRSSRTTFIVVGAGQSGAEALVYLMDNYPDCEVKVVSTGFIFQDAIDNPFVRLLQGGNARTAFHQIDRERRSGYAALVRKYNLGVVEEGLATAIARRIYDERVAGIARVEFLPFSELRFFKPHRNNVHVTIAVQGGACVREVTADCIICATGYDYGPTRELLNGIECLGEKVGVADIERDYSNCVEMNDGGSRLFLQDCGDPLHGITEGSVSDAAIVADRIVRRVWCGESHLPEGSGQCGHELTMA